MAVIDQSCYSSKKDHSTTCNIYEWSSSLSGGCDTDPNQPWSPGVSITSRMMLLQTNIRFTIWHTKSKNKDTNSKSHQVFDLRQCHQDLGK